MTRAELFMLGRQVAAQLPATLKPTKADFRAAALALGVTQALAVKAWNAFTWD